MTEKAKTLKSKPEKSDKKKTIKTASSIVLLGVSGWFLWHTFLAVPEATLPRSLAPTIATTNPAPDMQNADSVAGAIDVVEQVATDPDEMIDELLMVTGWYKQVDDIPDQLLQGAQQSSDKPHDPETILKVEQLVTEAFAPELFKQHLQTSLKNDFEQGRTERLLQQYNQSWLQTITQLEIQEIEPAALQTYAAGLTSSPLSEKRWQLIQEVDSAFQLTEFAVELTMGMALALLNGSTDNEESAMTEFEQIKRELQEETRDQIFFYLAYVYRELTDSEFEAYVEFLTSDDSMWLNTILTQATMEKLNAGTLQIGQQLAALDKPTDPIAELPSSEPVLIEDTLMSDSVPAKNHQYALTARSYLDARECLNLTGNMDIHRCADNYR